MSINPTLTADRLREVLDYDPDTGVFRWRIRASQGMRAGDVAGSVHHSGYRQIIVRGVQYAAHRLAWLYVHDEWPTGQIDHRNGDRLDNRLANLREATNGQNQQNQSRPCRQNKSGFLGVTPGPRGGQWKAQIQSDGRYYYLGLFDTPEQASAAYLRAKRELHPFWDEAV